MISSKSMREKDYESLKTEHAIVTELHDSIKMWYAYQHHHRVWEYSMALHALNKVFPGYHCDTGDAWPLRLVVSDHGCGCGYMSPLLLWLGCNVYMYECWTWGDDSKFMMEQMNRVRLVKKDQVGFYELRARGLGQLVEDDKEIDAAFCISTLEHIRDYQTAFRDFLGTVKEGGLAFLTTDFAEDEADHYAFNNLRAGKMFTKDTYMELLGIARDMGFRLLDGGADWSWDAECRLINDYGFASMALRRSE